MNDQTTREAVENLTVGQHISDTHGVHQIMHRLPYNNANGTPTIALTLLPLGVGEPWVSRHLEGTTLRIASDAEIREYADARRREGLAGQLHLLAGEITDLRLPVPRYDLSVGGCLDSRAAVEAWAQHLGVDIRMGGTDGDIPVAQQELRLSDGARLRIHFQGPSEPTPKHGHVAGSAGGPGECSAVCACGVTFDGFDTLGEAVAVLDRHIANPEPDTLADAAPVGQ